MCLDWASSCGRLQLTLTADDAASGMHQGDCEEDVRELLRRPYILAQVAKWDPDDVRRHLREYGAWDDDELSDDDANLRRQLWLACGDLVEEERSDDD